MQAEHNPRMQLIKQYLPLPLLHNYIPTVIYIPSFKSIHPQVNPSQYPMPPTLVSAIFSYPNHPLRSPPTAATRRTRMTATRKITTPIPLRPNLVLRIQIRPLQKPPASWMNADSGCCCCYCYSFCGRYFSLLILHYILRWRKVSLPVLDYQHAFFFLLPSLFHSFSLFTIYMHLHLH